MKRSVIIVFFIAFAFFLFLALRDEGNKYNPIKDGMPHNTSGDEWKQGPERKKWKQIPHPEKESPADVKEDKTQSFMRAFTILLGFFLFVLLSKKLVRHFRSKNAPKSGQSYNPSKDGMETDTSGDEWDQGKKD